GCRLPRPRRTRGRACSVRAIVLQNRARRPESSVPLAPENEVRMTQRSLKIGLIQTTVGLDKAANVEKTVLAIRDAAKRGASLICLQELFATQSFCQTEDAANFDLAEPVSGPTVQAIAKVAKECEVSVVTPFF